MDLEDDFECDLYQEYCTSGVTKDNQALVKYYEPIWENQLKLKLGQDHNFEIFSIVLLFKD